MKRWPQLLAILIGSAFAGGTFAAPIQQDFAETIAVILTPVGSAAARTPALLMNISLQKQMDGGDVWDLSYGTLIPDDKGGPCMVRLGASTSRDRRSHVSKPLELRKWIFGKHVEFEFLYGGSGRILVSLDYSKGFWGGSGRGVYRTTKKGQGIDVNLVAQRTFKACPELTFFPE